MAKVSTDRAVAGQKYFPLPVHDKTATAKVNGTNATIASQNSQSVTLSVACAQDDTVAITFNPVDSYGQGRTETFAPLTGATVTPTAACGLALIQPAATIAALTIKQPTTPNRDTQVFRVVTTQAVTEVTWDANVVGAPEELTAGQAVTFTWSSATSKWYKTA